ncbi:MAG: LD-carboxypeptidase, partial [Candidatus Limnocylindrales bacterium]
STQHVAYHLAGLVTFYGPSVMAGFAQMRHFPEAAAHARAMLFGEVASGEFVPLPRWVDAYAPWTSPDGASGIGPSFEHDGWRWLNGARATTGRLFGGCIDTLEMLKGTAWWPNADPDFWRDRVLFLETSEDKPTPSMVRTWLRNYGAAGVFERIAALWIGRARDYSAEEKAQLDYVLMDVVVGEIGASQLPIVSNLDFGHTAPQWVLPLGLLVETDPEARTLRWLESPVVASSTP